MISQWALNPGLPIWFKAGLDSVSSDQSRALPFCLSGRLNSRLELFDQVALSMVLVTGLHKTSCVAV